jgi:hypothetical protein
VRLYGGSVTLRIQSLVTTHFFNTTCNLPTLETVVWA